MIYLRHKRVNLLCGPKNMGKGCMSMVLVHTTFDQVDLDTRVLCCIVCIKDTSWYCNCICLAVTMNIRYRIYATNGLR